VSAAELVVFVESVTWNVAADAPAVVGIPEICPAAFNVSPAGRFPDASLHEYGCDPPVAFKDAL
jgi:hypothetical protein